MSATPDDKALLLHAPDSEKWAKFMSSRLATPQYNITCISKDVTKSSSKTPDKKATAATPASTPASTKDINDNVNNDKDASRDSGRAGSPLDESFRCQDPASNCRVSVIFLSPDIVESDQPFCVDVTTLNSKKTVFLFLGVDIEEARRFFGDKSDYVFKCRLCIIDGSEPAIVDALVQIIEACEDDGKDEDNEDEKEAGDIYNIPPSPKQLNSIQKVFPHELTEAERDLYILLERPAEDDVIVVLDTPKSQEITLTCVCERLYMFNVPADVVGEIFFRVECQGVLFGEDSFQVQTKLDRLKAILKDEVNPLSVLAMALGIKSDDVGGVDTALAFRIQQLAPAGTFSSMFPCEDALTHSEVRSPVLYPSLLHFAADLNLRTFCSELLHFPGMLAAACTENKDGEFPSQIAARKGFTQLESELTQFVEDNKRVVDMDENNLYIMPSPMCIPPTASAPASVSSKPIPAPKPHTSFTSNKPDYVNQQKETQNNESNNYIAMDRLPQLEVHGKRSDSRLSPLAKSTQDDIVFNKSNDSDEDGDNISEYQNLGALSLNISRKGEGSESGSDYSLSPRVSPRDGPRDSSPGPDKYSPMNSPGGTSRKALKMLGVNQEDITRSVSNTSENSQTSHTLSRVESQVSTESVFSSSVSPQGMKYTGMGQMVSPGEDRWSLSSNCDNPSSYSTAAQAQVPNAKKGAMTQKIMHFFGKVRKPKRANSDGEISFSSASGLKKSSSNRSVRGIQSSIQSGSRKKKSLASESQEPQERDSGSYSDEEKEKASPLPAKRNNKPKVFKERGRPMSRKPSQRAQLAMSERIDNAPTLPSTGSKRKGAFRSFIEEKP